MPYVDTSFIVKLYVKENHSLETTEWIRSRNEALPLTSLHDLEFSNAVCLKLFRKEIKKDQHDLILSRFNEHQKMGIYYHPPVDWVDIWNTSIKLSRKYTPDTGSRSLDILHVATAITMKIPEFLTFDEKQATLATSAGIKVLKIIKDV